MLIIIHCNFHKIKFGSHKVLKRKRSDSKTDNSTHSKNILLCRSGIYLKIDNKENKEIDIEYKYLEHLLAEFVEHIQPNTQYNLNLKYKQYNLWGKQHIPMLLVKDNSHLYKLGIKQDYLDCI